jgi:hypothetical protein
MKPSKNAAFGVAAMHPSIEEQTSKNNIEKIKSTHKAIELWKRIFFKKMANRCLIQALVYLLFAIKYLFLALFIVLLLSYIIPDKFVALLYPVEEIKKMQDFTLKIIAGGFINQFFTSIFGKSQSRS